MKLRITIFAALALIAFDRVSAAEESSQSLLIKIADQVGMNRSSRPNGPWHGLPHRHTYGVYPVACEAVIFPRSPFCAGRPATFGPYGPFHLPWNYWYY
jgi:hypothetical protein